MSKRRVAGILYGIPFVVVGVQHFVDPAWFEPIVPPGIGSPRFWVFVSGVAEIAVGLGLCLPRFRRKAALALALLLVGLYWANLNMWVNDIEIGGVTLSTTGHVIRGLVQAGMILGALWLGQWPPFRSSAQATDDAASD